MNVKMLAVAHIITKNPILCDGDDVKHKYLFFLKALVKAGGWNRRKYENSELLAYEKIISDSSSHRDRHEIEYYKYFLLFDLYHILGYEVKKTDVEKFDVIKEKYMSMFPRSDIDKKLVNKIINAFVSGNVNQIKNIAQNDVLVAEKTYIDLIIKNISFIYRKPVSIMVTATMSAGKSTFINALTGKYICLSQNMACTSKIHSIINKAFEDDFAYEYDHDLVLTAGRDELLNDNDLNSSDQIVVGTKFVGGLSEERIIVNDSPGVNFSGNHEHRVITERLIKRKKYSLLIYVLDATQLRSNDESAHLEYVKRIIGRKPILFVINKSDGLIVEEEDIEEIINRQKQYLEKKGFRKPLVCPVSARAGYLAKKYMTEKLSKIEERELYNFVDKFEKMGLKRYYAREFPNIIISDAEREEEQLIKTSGLAYVEKIIEELIRQ